MAEIKNVVNHVNLKDVIRYENIEVVYYLDILVDFYFTKDSKVVVFVNFKIAGIFLDSLKNIEVVDWLIVIVLDKIKILGLKHL